MVNTLQSLSSEWYGIEYLLVHFKVELAELSINWWTLELYGLRRDYHEDRRYPNRGSNIECHVLSDDSVHSMDLSKNMSGIARFPIRYPAGHHTKTASAT